MRKVLDWFRFAGPNPYEKMYFDLKAEFMGLSDLNKKMLKDWSKSQASADDYKAKFEALQKKYDELYETMYGVIPDDGFVAAMATAISKDKNLSRPLNSGIKKAGEIHINRRRRELDPIDDGDGDDDTYNDRHRFDIPAAVLVGMMLSNTTVSSSASSSPSPVPAYGDHHSGSVNVYDSRSSSESSYSSSSSDSSSSDSSSSSSSGGGGSD